MTRVINPPNTER